MCHLRVSAQSSMGRSLARTSVFVGLHVVVGEECMARQALDWQQSIVAYCQTKEEVGYSPFVYIVRTDQRPG